MHYEPKACVIGIDTSSDGSNEPNALVAAVGASAIIDDSLPGSFTRPSQRLGRTSRRGSSFIFPNVDVGSTEIMSLHRLG